MSIEPSESQVRSTNRLTIAVAVMSVVLIIVGVVGLIFVNVVNDVKPLLEEARSEIDATREEQLQGKARACRYYAVTAPLAFSPSCLDEDAVAIYGRDTVDALMREGEQGEVRLRICEALSRQGVQDEDCI